MQQLANQYQNNLWTEYQKNKRRLDYNLFFGYNITGELDVKLFVDSFAKLLHLHLELSSTFSYINNELIQVVPEHPNVSIQFQDYIEIDDETIQQQLDHDILKIYATPYDLEKEALIRVHLIKLSDRKHVLLLGFHHIIIDAASLQMVLDELSALYNNNQVLQPKQYRSRTIQGSPCQDDLEKNTPNNFIKLNFPRLSKIDKAKQSPRKIHEDAGLRSYRVFNSLMTEKIYNILEGYNCTPFIFFISVLAYLAYKITGQDEFAIGYAQSNLEYFPPRQASFSVSVLSCLFCVDETIGFNEFIHSVKENQKNKVITDTARDPLASNINIAINTSTYLSHPLSLNKTNCEPIKINYAFAPYHLLLRFDCNEEILTEFEAHSDFFDKKLLNHYIDGYVSILEQIIKDPKIKLHDICLPMKKGTLDCKLNYPKAAKSNTNKMNIDNLLNHYNHEMPDKVALVEDSLHLTYSTLFNKVEQLHQMLLSENIAIGARVAILAEKSYQSIIAMLAVIKLGAVYVPIDVHYPTLRILKILNACRPQCLLLSTEPERSISDSIKCINYSNILSKPYYACKSSNIVHKVPENRSLYIIYTSGSTGEPKGVVITVDNLLNLLRFQKRIKLVDIDSRIIQFSSLSFDASIWEIFSSLYSGATLQIFAKSNKTVDLLGGFLNKYCISTALFLPSLAQTIKPYPTYLNTLILGGERVTAHTLLKYIYDTKLFIAYGPTEGTVYASLLDCNQSEYLSVGRSIDNVDIVIMDEQDCFLDVGYVGEIAITGKNLSPGYWENPSADAKYFSKINLYNNADHKASTIIYKTGDLGRYLPDGSIQYLGRIDNQVKIRGYRIELDEITNIFCSHPVIQDACTLVVDEANSKKIVTFCELIKEHEAVTNEDFDNVLFDYARQYMPEYMLPATIKFIHSLPRKVSGKIDNVQLLAHYARDKKLNVNIISTAKMTTTELLLAKHWQKILSLDVIKKEDDFFNLGGDSLSGVQLISSCFGEGLIFTLDDLFDHSTLHDLAAHIDLIRQTTERNQPTQLISSVFKDETTQNYLLSRQQLQLWINYQLLNNDTIPIVISLTGKVSQDALLTAIKKLVNRHAILRTCFKLSDNQSPIQFIHPPLDEVSEFYNFFDLVTCDDKAANEKVKEFIEQKFDFSSLPLFKVALFTLPNKRYKLVFLMHHLVTDDHANKIFFTEFTNLYQAACIGEEVNLPELPIQYVDYALWQQEQITSDKWKNSIDYWQNQLQGHSGILALPTDFQRTTQASYQGNYLEMELPKATVEGLMGITQRHQVTLFMVLLSALYILLNRITGESDIVIGSPVANRHPAELEGLLGFFVNNIALRANLNSSQVFSDFLANIKSLTLDAYTHQSVPIDVILDKLLIPRNLTHHPLFQVMFSYHNINPTAMPDFFDCTVQDVKLVHQGAKFDLSLNVYKTSDDALMVGFEYATDLFKQETIETLLESYAALLQHVLSNTDSPLQSLSIVSAQQAREALRVGTGMVNTALQGQSIIAHFDQQVKKHPDAMAVFSETQVQLSYEGLRAAALRLANVWREQGIQAGDVVGIHLPQDLYHVIAMLASWYLGATYLPLDPMYPDSRLFYMIEDAMVHMLVSASIEETQAGTLKTLLCHETNLKAIITRDLAIEVSDFNVTYHGETLAAIFYTSGTTGQPKGVQLTHRNLCHRILWTLDTYATTELPRLIPIASPAFDISLWESCYPLLGGGCTFLSRMSQGFSPQRLIDYMYLYHINIMHFVPSLLKKMLSVGLTRCQELAYVICGGEAVSYDLQQSFHQQCPGIQLHVSYGPTEAGICITNWLSKPNYNDSLVPLGEVVANSRIYILDHCRQLLPIGLPGMMYVASEQVSLGYLNRSKASNENYFKDIFEPSSVMYRTGDRGKYLSDGNLVFLGREDNQIKLRGYRIELGEVEGALLLEKAIKHAVVNVCKSEAGEDILVAYVELTKDVEATDATLRKRWQESLSQKLPNYMVPSYFELVKEFTLTVNGKIDRKCLPEFHHKRQSSTAIKLAAPRNDIEEALHTIWKEVLHIDAIGIYDNFFELGGNSLIAIEIIMKVYEALKVKISIKDIFECFTIAGIAEKIQVTKKSLSNTSINLIKNPSDKQAPVSSAQQRIWLLEQMLPQKGIYNVSLSINIKGELNVENFMQAFSMLTKKHKILASNFFSDESGAVFLKYHQQAINVALYDFVEYEDDPEEQETLINEIIEQEVSYQFDLSKDVLIRSSLFVKNAQESIYLLVLHHIISDEWSMKVFFDELNNYYCQLINGEAISLKDNTFDYGDYAYTERTNSKTSQLNGNLQYWLEHLKGVPTLLDFPADRSRPAHNHYQGGYCCLVHEQPLKKQLQDFAIKHNLSLATLLFSCFAIMVHRLSGVSRFIIGLPVANRKYSETKDMLGFFVNTLPIGVTMQGDNSFLEIIKQVNDSLLKAHEHQDIPFDNLVKELRVEGQQKNCNPIYQVLFSYQNNVPENYVHLDNLSTSIRQLPHKISRLDLTFKVYMTESGLHTGFEYATSLFDRLTIMKLLKVFHTITQAVILDPRLQVSEIPLLDEREYQAILSASTGKQIIDDAFQSFIACFKSQVNAKPSAIAIRSGSKNITYEELDTYSNNIAKWLQDNGAKFNCKVGVLYPKSIDYIACMLAIFKIGCIYVPLDPSHPCQRTEYIIRDSAIDFVISQETIHALPTKCISLDTMDAMISSTKEWQQEIDYKQYHNNDGAYIIYTSGSSGAPKAIKIKQHNIINYINAIKSQLQLKPNFDFATLAGFTTDFAYTAIFSALAFGGTFRFFSEEDTLRPENLIKLFRQYPTDYLKIVPSHLESMLDCDDIKSIFPTKALIFGGEKLTTNIINKLRELDLACQIINHYGPTESTIGICTHQLNKRYFTKQTSIPIGKPLMNSAVYILDQYKNLLPMGIKGELYLSGAGLGEYTGQIADSDVQRFSCNPFMGSNANLQRLYRTGDVGKFDRAQNIIYLNRINDDQIKIRGYRVELSEIENVIMRFPDTKQCCVLAHTNHVGKNTLYAFVLLKDLHNEKSLVNLKIFIKAWLPKYAIPNDILAIQAMPILASGKINKTALRNSINGARKVNIPKKVTLSEKQIAKAMYDIWQMVLKIDNFSYEDDFFELGGDSLDAVRIVTFANKQGINLDIDHIFDYPSIHMLTQALVEKSKASQENNYLIPKHSSRVNVPTSFAQRRLYIAARESKNTQLYNVPIIFKLRGHLSEKALAYAFYTCLRRHEILRTTFSLVDKDQIVQNIHDVETFANFPLTLYDWRAHDYSEFTICEKISQELLEDNFDLDTPLLFNVKVIKWVGQVNFIVINMHHLISDAWSKHILYSELSHHYKMACMGKKEDLPELPIQYADYALWQQEQITSDKWKNSIDYWQNQLQGHSGILALPTDFQRTTQASYQGNYLEMELPKATVEGLMGITQRHQVTLFMVLLSALYILLNRITGESDIVIGSPVANRHPAELEGLLGFFVNNIALRANLNSSQVFSDFLANIKSLTLDAYTHQSVPIDVILDKLLIPRNLTHHPLFQVMFSYHNINPTAMPDFFDCTVQDVKLVHQGAKFDLSLNVYKTSDDALMVGFEYATDLFKQETIETLLESYAALLQHVLSNTDSPLQSLSIVSAQQAREALRVGTGMVNTALQGQSIIAHFDQQVKKHPDAMAVFSETQVQLSYEGLRAAALRLANVWREQGIQAGDVVGIHLPQDLYHVIAMLASWYLGATYLPLDPMYPDSRLFYMIEDAMVHMLVSASIEETQAGTLKTLLCHETNLKAIITRDLAIEVSDFNVTYHGETLAAIFYTSGTTGQPKGVQLTHRNLCHRILWTLDTYATTELPRLIPIASPAFDISLWESCYPLLGGGCTFLSRMSQGFSPQRLIDYMYLYHINIMHFVPSLLKKMLSVGLTRCQELAYVICGGEAVSYDLQQSFHQQCPGIQLHVSYGPTEAGICITNWLSKPNYNDSLVPLGEVVANSRIYILDHCRQLLPIGLPGMMYVASEQVSLGYLNRSKASNENYFKDIFEPSSVMYRTGDRGKYLSDGNLVFLGREDNQIKLRGYRIELGEVEGALLLEKAIKHAVVNVCKSEAGEDILVAYVELTKDVEATDATLRKRWQESLSQKLPNYMVPSYFELVKEFTLTVNGKIDRKCLPEFHHKRQSSTAIKLAAPRNDIEEALHTIWKEVLHIDAIGIYDNFFELGGSSLSAIEIITRVSELYGKTIELAMLLTHSNIADFGAWISKNMTSLPVKSSPITHSECNRYVDISPFQSGMWLSEKIFSNSAIYNIPVVYSLRGYLNKKALVESIALISQANQLLCASIIEDEQIPKFDLQSNNIVKPDMMKLNGNVSKKEIYQRIKAFCKGKFQKDDALLWKVLLIEVSSTQHFLCFVFHHVLLDAQSLQIFIQELTQFYNQTVCELPSIDLKNKIQHTDYMTWREANLSSTMLNAQRNFWSKKLLTIQDHSKHYLSGNDSNHELAGDSVSIRTTRFLAKHIKAFAARQNTSVFVLTLSVFFALLSRYSQENEVIIGTPITVRNKKELKNVIGCFINLLPVVISLQENETCESLMAKISKAILEVQNNVDIPFQDIVKLLELPRHEKQHPIFQTVFSYQGNINNNLGMHGLKAELFGQSSGSKKTQFDLNLTIFDNDTCLDLTLLYKKSKLTRTQAKLLLNHYLNFLRMFIVKSTTQVVNVNYLTDYELSQLHRINAWNKPIPDKSVPEWLSRSMASHADTVAIIDGSSQITYAKLYEKANRLASRISAAGITSGFIVAVALSRGINFIIALLAIWLAKAVYVPLDLTHPDERINYILDNTDASLVLCDKQSQYRIQNRNILLIEHVDHAPRLTTTVQIPQHTQHEDAYIMYTSGSTGKPKGVIISHKAFYNHMLWMTSTFYANHSARIVHKTSVCFDPSLWELFLPLLTGGVLIIANDKVRQDVRTLAKLVDSHQANGIQIMPSALDLFLDYCTDSFLQNIFTGGESLARSSMQKCLENFTIKLHNLYAPTETTIDATYWPCSKAFTGNNLPIGKPILNTRIYILDKHKKQMPIGNVGEIYIGGIQVARGYLNNKKQSQAAFYKDLENPEQLMYKTGDLGKFSPTMDLLFLGRIDQQINLRGYRIEKEEVERAINDLDNIKQSVVIVENDGENINLNCYIALKSYASTDYDRQIAAWRLSLNKSIPNYMIPNHFYVVDNIPVTANGKVDKQKIICLPKVNQTGFDTRDNIRPSNIVEKQLHHLWCQTLLLDSIGIHDDFFQIGGHSLLAMKLAAQISETINCNLPAYKIFEYSTISSLAKYIVTSNKRSTTKFDKLMKIKKYPDNIPLSHSQQQLWFLQNYENTDQYNIAQIWRITGKLDISIMRQSFYHLLKDHSVLRTLIKSSKSNTPYQSIIEMTEIESYLKKSFNSTSMSLKNIKVPQDDFVKHVFDLENELPIRMLCVKHNQQQYSLILVLHHICCDGLALGLLNKSLSDIYNKILSDKILPDNSEQIQYVDYAIYENKMLKNSLSNDKLCYWKRMLANPPIVKLPFDKQRTDKHHLQCKNYSYSLSKPLTKQADIFIKDNGITEFMLHMAVFYELLALYANQRDIIIGVPYANRDTVGIENVIGYFVNPIPIRVNAEQHIKFIDLLKLIKKQTTDAYKNAYPFEALIDKLDIHRQFTYNPLFQVMFAYQNIQVENIDLSDCHISRIEVGERSTKFDLSLTVGIINEQLNLSFVYSDELFDEETLQQLSIHYEKILQQVIKQNTKALDKSALIDTHQLNILNKYNVLLPIEKSEVLHERFLLLAKQQPDCIALQMGSRFISYGYLTSLVNYASDFLREKGIKTKDIVAVNLPKSFEQIIMTIAISHIGATWVPLDMDSPVTRINKILNNTKIKFVLSNKASSRQFPTNIISLAIDDIKFTTCKQPYRLSPSQAQAKDIAYIAFTSGSTGKPKGVKVRHSAVSSSFSWATASFPFLEDDVILYASNYSSIDAIWDVFGTLNAGKRLVIMPESSHRNAKKVGDTITRYHVNRVVFLPSFVKALILTYPTLQPLRRIRHLEITGERLSNHTAETILNVLPKVNLIDAYGATEYTSIFYRKLYLASNTNNLAVDYYKAANTNTYILDDELNRLPPKCQGLLYVSGCGISDGYLSNSTKNDTSFTQGHEFNEGRKLYCTGDIAYYNNHGEIILVGRNEHTINYFGNRIDPGEIEEVIVNCAGITDAVVLNQINDDETILLKAYVTTKNNKQINIQQVYDSIKRELPYYMIPHSIIPITEMPYTHNGKIDKNGFSKLTKKINVQTEQRATKNATQKLLCESWRKILNKDEINIHDDFFDLGGNSLRSIELLYEIKKFGFDISLQDIFQYPTVDALSIMIDNQKTLANIFIDIKYTRQHMPIFMIHPAGGIALPYIKLKKYFKHDPYSIIGINHGFYCNHNQSFKDIDAMARYYLEMINKCYDHKQCIFAGWSFGGLVAYRMAQLSGEYGINGQLVILIDSINPNCIQSKKTSSSNDIQDAVKFALKLQEIEVDRNTQELIAKCMLETLNMHCAMEHYSGEVALIKALRPDKYNQNPVLYGVDNGWSSLVKQENLSIYPCDVSHLEMFSDDNIERVVKMLKEILDKHHISMSKSCAQKVIRRNDEEVLS